MNARHRMPALLALAVATAIAGGCASKQDKARGQQLEITAEGTAQPDSFRPSSNRIIGEIVHADLREGIAVVQISAPPGNLEAPLLVRDVDLEPTALLLASAYFKGRSLGVHILDGQPEVGDEVIQPGPTYQAMIQERLRKVTDKEKPPQ